ncbi:NAD(P)H-binding protein, partial [Actinomadura sp. 9N407]|uniref:NAD(P)H-binding protein n=1 Tax=Actinomadura sp. 9N407 TaxID=3375154 RepID=UPI0037A7EC54
GPVTADRRHRSGHSGSSIIPELIAAGHEVTGLARSDTAAAAVSALGAKVRRSDLKDLDGLMEAAADSDGVIHVAHRQDLLPFGGMNAVSAAEFPVMLAYGEALAGTGKPLVAAGSIGSSGKLGRPATEKDPALPVGDEHKGTLRVRNVVETAVIDLAERGVRSSVIATQSYPASNLITRRTLGWESAQPSLLADLDNGHYFPAG